MLAPARVEVVGGRVGDVASCVIRHNGDVIAYLVLLRPAFQRSKRIACRSVRREGHAAVGAVGVEQLRIGVICGVACVQPHRVDPPVRRDSDCAEPVIFTMVNRIVIDPLRRAKALSAVGAA